MEHLTVSIMLQCMHAVAAILWANVILPSSADSEVAQQCIPFLFVSQIVVLARLSRTLYGSAGGTPRFVTENRDALRSLMQLHPLNLSKPDNSTISQPPSPNPLLDTNPFGAVPLSALLQSSPTSLHTKQASRGGDDKHSDSDASIAQTPEGPRRLSAQSGRATLEPSVFQRQAALQASSFDDLVTQQVCPSQALSTDMLSAPLHLQIHLL